MRLFGPPTPPPTPEPVVLRVERFELASDLLDTYAVVRDLRASGAVVRAWDVRETCERPDGSTFPRWSTSMEIRRGLLADEPPGLRTARDLGAASAREPSGGRRYRDPKRR